MNKELDTLVTEFKDLSIMMLNAMDFENYDELDKLIAERQKNLNNIANMSFDKKELSQLIKKNNISLLEEKLEAKVRQHRDFLKGKLTEISEAKVIQKSYARQYNTSRFLNKKI